MLTQAALKQAPRRQLCPLACDRVDRAIQLQPVTCPHGERRRILESYRDRCAEVAGANLRLPRQLQRHKRRRRFRQLRRLLNLCLGRGCRGVGWRVGRRVGRRRWWLLRWWRCRQRLLRRRRGRCRWLLRTFHFARRSFATRRVGAAATTAAAITIVSVGAVLSPMARLAAFEACAAASTAAAPAAAAPAAATSAVSAPARPVARLLALEAHVSAAAATTATTTVAAADSVATSTTGRRGDATTGRRRRLIGPLEELAPALLLSLWAAEELAVGVARRVGRAHGAETEATRALHFGLRARRASACARALGATAAARRVGGAIARPMAWLLALEADVSLRARWWARRLLDGQVDRRRRGATAFEPA